MTVCSELADYEWLTGSEAGALLEELAAASRPLHSTVERLRRTLTASQTHLLIEQAELRRRAPAKFSQARRMFFTRIGLEQATDEWVAGYKATRLVERIGGRPSPVVADLCCGIGGDLIAFAGTCSTVGVDRDGVAAHFACVNANTIVQTADAAKFELNDVSAWHIDPDRRHGGTRTTSLDRCEPNRSVLDDLLKQSPNAAIKLAPACDVSPDWAARCELEWISRDRECRQLVAWHGELALAAGQRRATILAADSGVAIRTFIGLPGLPVPVCQTLERYVFDIDPAVLAAKLKGALAAEHDLRGLSSGPTYLTGPHKIDDSALSCFEIEELLPLRTNQLARWLRARNIGSLEIKKRGVDLHPEKLRHDLRLRGDNHATLLITPVAGSPTVIVAHRATR